MTVPRTYKEYQELAYRARFKNDSDARRVVDDLNADPDFAPSALPVDERERRRWASDADVRALEADGFEFWRAAMVVKQRRLEEEAGP